MKASEVRETPTDQLRDRPGVLTTTLRRESGTIRVPAGTVVLVKGKYGDALRVEVGPCAHCGISAELRLHATAVDLTAAERTAEPIETEDDGA